MFILLYNYNNFKLSFQVSMFAIFDNALFNIHNLGTVY